MITRQQLEVINRKTIKYPLHIAEKDYMLAVVLKLIVNSPIGEKLVFKGGTAIHHCYLSQHRFSEDLDFSTDKKLITLDEVRKVLESENYLTIKKDYESKATLKIERLLYTGPLGQPNSLKVEIDHMQNVLLKPKKLLYNNVWGFDFEVPTMDNREICAEKIRAMSDRARYRDFYDLYLLLEKYQLDLEEVIGLIEKKEIRQTIRLENIISNWALINSEKKREASRIFYSQTVEGSQIESMIDALPFDTISALN